MTIGLPLQRNLKSITKMSKILSVEKQILGYLVDYKDLTLLMNWKAQKNEELWKYSYDAYKKLASFSITEYLSSEFSFDLKKEKFFTKFYLPI